MSEQVKTALAELHQALENVDEVDPAMLELLQSVDGDIHTLESAGLKMKSGVYY